jgi:hypothetical protein
MHEKSMKFLLFAPLILAMCSSTVIAQAMLKKEPAPTPQAQASPSPAEAGAQHRDQWQVIDEVSKSESTSKPAPTVSEPPC